MEPLPYISVITVCRNSANTLERTIRSVVNQVYKSLEYIIIDGASTDGTVDIIKKYDKYITYWISEPDDGIYHAMNRALDISSGEYVIFLNSDDWFDGDVLGTIAEYIIKLDADVIYGDYYNVSSDGDKELRHPYPLEYIYWWMPFCHQASVIKNDKKLRFDTKYSQCADYKMMYDLYMEGKSFRYIPHIISNFSMGGISTGDKSKIWREVADISSTGLIAQSNKADDYKSIICNTYVKNEIYHRYVTGEYDDEIASFIEAFIGTDRDVVIFGTGEILSRYRDYIGRTKVRVKYLIDNDKCSWYKEKYGYMVYPPAYALEESHISICVLTVKYSYEILDQINESKCNADIQVFTYSDMRDRFRQIHYDEILEFGKNTIESFAHLMEL